MWTIAFAAVAGRDPEFTRHPAEAALVGSPIPPTLASAKARKFRTHLRDVAAEGVNFNGHYRVTHWGQGTNVIEWAVIDLQTGAVWFAPDIVGSCPVQDDRAQGVSNWTESHPDSALLYLHECREGVGGGRIFDTRLV